MDLAISEWNFCNESEMAKVLLFFVIISANVNAGEVALRDLLGLYKVTQCDVKSERTKENQYDCKQDLFFELVQGQFAGVNSDEVAYVLWSGDQPELNYVANKVNSQLSSDSDKTSILINQDENGVETLILANDRLVKFHSKFTVNGRDEQIEYTLAPVRRAELPDVILNYPEK